MINKKDYVVSQVEAFFMGISCLISLEQFEIHLSHTNCSVKIQGIILITVALATLTVSGFLKYYDFYLTTIHLSYLLHLLFSILFVSKKIDSFIIATSSTFCFGYMSTLVIVFSCCEYCANRKRILCFILGLFASRYPPLVYLQLSKKTDYKSEIHSISVFLSYIRFASCLISICLKALDGELHFPIDKSTGEKMSEYFNKIKENVEGIWKHKRFWFDIRVFTDTQASNNYYSEYLKPVFRSMPFFHFFIPVLIFLTYPKTTIKSCYTYSPNVIFNVLHLKTLIHIIGSLFGIALPITVSSNSSLFSTITFLFYYLFAHYFILPVSDRYFRQYSLYFLVIISSFVLGYLWSYNLGLIINMVLKETCVYEEVETFDKTNFFNEKGPIVMKKTCCGDKITSKCYCKLEEVFNFFDLKYKGKTFECSKLFVRDDQYLSYTYSKYGKCAILLIYDGDGSECSKTCEQSCCQSNCDSKCCLKIIGKYKLQNVTVSSCEDCQLTVRLEGDCADPDKCPTCCGSGAECGCQGSNGNCCCICVKCCTNTCSTQNCCCIHFCKKEGCSCKCTCDKTKGKDSRLFICYKANGEKCCIKEIKPNDSADFIGDLKIKSQFDIDHIFISDCCHVGVRVDLKCTVKNNYFRLGGANYPNKFEKPNELSLLCSNSICCKPGASSTQCCCKFRNLTRACLKFSESTETCPTTIEAPCCCGSQSNCECCKTVCKLKLNDNGAFAKRVNEMKSHIVVIWWTLFLLIYTISVLIPSMSRASSYRKCCVKTFVSFSDLTKSNKVHFVSDQQISGRLDDLIKSGHPSEFTLKKKLELKSMMSAFKGNMTAKDFGKFSEHLSKKAASYSSGCRKSEHRSLDTSVVAWCYCVGFMYKYALKVLLSIQKFFANWEKVWLIEVDTTDELIDPGVNKVSHKSKIGLSHSSQVDFSPNFKTIGFGRMLTWNDLRSHVIDVSKMTYTERGLFGKGLTPKIGKRLEKYVDRWNHRLGYIHHWIQTGICTFDWSIFLNQHYMIRKWVKAVSPHLNEIKDIKIPTKQLNKGTEVFLR